MRCCRLLLAAALLALPAAGQDAAEAPPTYRLEAGGGPLLVPLTLAGSVGERVDLRVEWQGEPVEAAIVAREAPGTPITSYTFEREGLAAFHLALAAGRCSRGRRAEGRLVVGSSRAVARAAHPFRVAVDAKPSRCIAPVAGALLGLLVGLVCSWGMAHTYLLPAKEHLATVVRWTAGGSERAPAAEIAMLLAAPLRLHRRLANWLRSNPLRFVRPGHRYRETLRLDLDRRGPGRSAARLVPRADLPALVEGVPDHWAGAIFLTAEPDAAPRLWAVPDREGRIGPWRLVGPNVRPGRPVSLRRRRHGLVASAGSETLDEAVWRF